jgi:hypothetical protein
VASLAKLALKLLRRTGPSTRPALLPPRNRFERVQALTAHWGFNLSLATTVLLFAGLLATSSSSTWLNSVRLALGVLLLVEGFLLAKNWRGSRRLVLWRLQRRRLAAGPVSASLRRRFAEPFFDPGLQLLGLMWLAAGLLTVILTLQHLV